MSGMQADEADDFRDPACAVTRRISTLGRPKLVSRHRGPARRPQVVQALRDMHVAQRRDHHEFDNGVVLDQGVGGCNNRASPLSTCILCIRLE
jgi:hypothetical protein